MPIVDTVEKRESCCQYLFCAYLCCATVFWMNSMFHFCIPLFTWSLWLGYTLLWESLRLLVSRAALLLVAFGRRNVSSLRLREMVECSSSHGVIPKVIVARVFISKVFRSNYASTWLTPRLFFRYYYLVQPMFFRLSTNFQKTTRYFCRRSWGQLARRQLLSDCGHEWIWAYWLRP